MELKLGVIGLQHFHVYGFVKDLQATGNVRMVAGADEDAALRQEMADKFGVPVYSDYRRLLEVERPDAVVLSNVNNRRADAICDCASAGVHVLADKPLATTLADLERVERAVDESGIRLASLIAGGYGALSQGLKAAIEGGELGELVQLASLSPHRWRLDPKLGWQRPAWNYDPEQYGGCIIVDGIHGINELRWLTGAEVLNVAAAHTNRSFPQHPGFTDSCSILMGMGRGISCFVGMNWLTPAAEPSHGRSATYIYGTKGMISVTSRGVAHGLEQARSGPEVMIVTDDRPPQELALPQGERRTLERDFVDSIVEDREPLIASRFILQSMRVALLAREAADQRRTIAVEPGG